MSSKRTGLPKHPLEVVARCTISLGQGAAASPKRLGAAPALVFPPSFKAGRCQLGVAYRVLYVFVAQVGLQAARIVPLVRKLIAAGVSKHMRVRLDLEPGCLASPGDELLEVAHGHRRAALGHEQEG